MLRTNELVATFGIATGRIWSTHVAYLPASELEPENVVLG